ncbi:phage tail protein [Neptuniibacter marinus]|uniref:phage tail protein n=1 Tax=Neptuniibacter marinus TaxID=1806670 RepID=UPI003B5CD8E5
MGGGKGGEQTVGYKYHSGVHFTLCHGPADKIIDMQYADRECWIGEESGSSTGYGQMVVNKPSLLGGDKREGGVQGTIDVGMGYPEQPINSYLSTKLGGFVPGFRGVVSLIAKQFYWGNNPYLKAVNWLVQRIHTRSDGSEQWYDEKAEVLNFSLTGETFRESFTGESLSEYSYYDFPSAIGQGSMSDFGIVDDDFGPAIFVGTGPDLTSVHISAYKTIVLNTSNRPLQHISFKFKALSFGPNDSPGLVFRDSSFNTVFSFNTRRDESVDVLRRPTFSFTDISGSAGYPVGLGSVDIDTWYYVTVDYVNEAELFLGKVVNYSTQEVFGEVTIPVGVLNQITSIHFENDHDSSSHAGTGLFDDIVASAAATAGDMNPAHIIREIMTDTVWGAGFPEPEIGTSYSGIADTLFDEGLGLSFLFSDEIPYSEMIDEVMRHIDAVRYEDPETGLQEIKLIRGDYDVGTLPLLDKTNSTLEQITNPSDYELVNQIIVKYWNRETNSYSTLTLQDTAAINMVGHIVSQTMEYSGVTNDNVALQIGLRDLARFSRPFHKGRIVTNRKFFNLKPGDLFRLTDLDSGVSEMICRVTNRKESGALSGEITIEFGEDVFGHEYSAYALPAKTKWVDPVGDPLSFSHDTAFELPYLLIVKQVGETAIAQLNDTSSFFGFAGARPESGAHINYDLYVYPDGAVQNPDSEFSISADFTPIAVVDTDVDDPSEVIIPVLPLDAMDSVREDQIILVGDGADTVREVVSLSATVSDGDTSITVKRGVIDTIPRPITAGTVLYFVGTFSANSDTEFLPGETVEGYGAPKNGNGYYLGPYNYHDLLMRGRFNRPYPAANFKIDGVYPAAMVQPTSSTVQLTWRHRDRITQSDQVIAYYDDTDYGPENGTTYRVESDAYDANGDLITANWLSTDVGLVGAYSLNVAAAPIGSRSINVRVWTVRGGEDSLQSVNAVILLDGDLLVTADSEPFITADGQYLITGS